MKEIKVGTAVSNGTGVTRGTLRTVDRPDGAPVEIPVVIIRGAGDGPTLWLHGCVHGNEYCGTYIIHELPSLAGPGRDGGRRRGVADPESRRVSAQPAHEPVRGLWRRATSTDVSPAIPPAR